MSNYSLRHLSDDALAQGLERSTSDDRRSIARNIAHIAEYDRRQSYLPAGCKSMYRYCVSRLGMSEDVALQRIRVGRVALRHPPVFEAIAESRLSVSAVYLASSHLSREGATELLAAIERMTLKQVRRFLAERFGRLPPMAPDRGLPESVEAGDALPADGQARAGLVVSKPPSVTTPETLTHETERDEASAGTAPAPLPARRARLTPVAAGWSELVALLGQEACDQLEASRELLGHAVPSGDLAEVLERAIALQYAQLRKRRCGATDRPRAHVPTRSEGSSARGGANCPANLRCVPRAVRRAVWDRDRGQCAYVSPDGHRCEERAALELDHIMPVARGGQPTVENLRLLCRAHNRHAAERAFGRDALRARIETARSRRAAERMRKEADRARTEARRAAMARQDEELGTALRNLGYRGQDLRRALALCADRADAPPEARLRHALGCMAPRARREPAAGDGAAA